MLNDLRYGLRTLRRSPLFTMVAVLSLALGIGANTAIFSLLSQVMFRMLPVTDPERLVVFHAAGEREGSSSMDSQEAVFSYPMYKDLRDRNQVFSGVLARSSAPVSLSSGGQTDRVRAEVVSGNFFEVLGVQAALGRVFTADDDRVPGGHPVVILSHGYWKRRFGGNSAILNQTVNVNGHPMVVIGIAPAGFHGVLSGDTPDLLLPIMMKREASPDWNSFDDRQYRWLNIFARLKPGVPTKQAEAAMQVLYRAASEEDLARMKNPLRAHARDEYLAQKLELRAAAQGINSLRADWETPLVALMAMVGLVLLIACANVANLMLARATGRQREIAIRLAVGADRWAIVRQLVVESLLIAGAGGLLGLLVANWFAAALLHFLPGDATGGWLTASLDWRTLGFSAALAIGTGTLFGLAPAVASTRPDLAPVLKEQSGNAVAGGAQARFRKLFIVAQVALSLLLLVGAGLFARSLFNLMTEDAGFRAAKLLRFSVDPSLNGYEPARGWAFYRELQQRLAALPGVRAVGGAFLGPFGHGRRAGNITVEGYRAKEDEYVGASQDGLSANYFRTLGIPVIAGREFTERDGAGTPRVAIVNETFVKRYAKSGNVIGRRMAFGGGDKVQLDREIVGVVRDSKYSSLREQADPFVYIPAAQQDRLERMTFFVRAERNETELGPQIRALVRNMDANLPVFAMISMDVQIADSIYRDRLIAILASAFGMLATLLAAIGLYGVVAFNVARRTAEMGLRMALGALPGDVLGLVMKEVGWLVAAGALIGLAAAAGLSRYVESQLFGVKANDPITFLLATCVLGLSAGLAGYIPARRAARIDPIKALRYE
ncbi:MAG TPA: ABC transporter permease [Bryobacteraceae bacterium]|nr:ABC transporter permease [Bryobacteraceae bacterium]